MLKAALSKQVACQGKSWSQAQIRNRSNMFPQVQISLLVALNGVPSGWLLLGRGAKQRCFCTNGACPATKCGAGRG